ncbi:MAG: STT3 domain-containing protein [Candidatus Eiseniibacteriota bacterium]
MAPVLTRRFAWVLAAVAGTSWLAREVQHQRVALSGHESWVTTDADTLYHLRRTERVLREGLPVAETDSYLNHPQGSAVPWPPYYTLITAAAAAPFAPDDPGGRRAHVERTVASLPLVFGVVTTLLATFAARALAGDVAGLIAGGIHALSQGSIAYSKGGNGDHHAWITMLQAALLLGLSSALARRALSPRQGWTRGAALGAIAGVMLGSWIASLLYVAPLQLVLAWRAVRHARRPEPGVPALAFAFHAAALLVLLPAATSSPWNEANPWMVVNLSWFHAAWLGAGAAAFAPLLFLGEGRALRSYPAVAALAGAALAGVLVAADTAPVAAVREGFAWMSREEDFMASVWESRGLLGEGAAFDPIGVLGAGIIALPFAWAAMAWLAFRRDRFALLPWAVVAPLLAVEAARQVRFADALAMPLAVVVAWGLVTATRARVVRTRVPRTLAKSPAAAWAAAALATILLQWTTASATLGRTLSGDRGNPAHPNDVAMREMCEWLRRSSSPGDAVLADWNHGHVIEWAADRPTVATNFGTYVGEDSFRDPSRFFLEEDADAAEKLLGARGARYVMLTSWLPGTVRHMVRTAASEREARYLEPSREDEAKLRFEWFRTMGARLMVDGAVITPDRGPVGSLDFLRLVHVSPRRDPRPNPRGEPSPAGWIWEHVPGAVIESAGLPGEELRVRVIVRFEAARYETQWETAARCGADGLARVRIPWATDVPNGDAKAHNASWSLGGRGGPLTVPQAAVSAGSLLRIG